MKQARTITDLNAKFQQRVKKLTEEYDYQRLQAQTFADYLVALGIAYERERARINGEVEQMEFMVTRTSGWSYSKPCDEAYEKNYMRKDIRTLKSFEEYDNRFRDNFLDTGDRKSTRLNSSHWW